MRDANVRNHLNKQLLDEVFVISRIIKVEVRVIPYRDLDYYGHRKIPANLITSHVFASSLTASNTKHANLTLLLLGIMQCGHT